MTEVVVQVLLGMEPTRLVQMYRHTSNAHPSPGDPPESIGDCYRTAIACLMSARRPDWVPHFGAMNLDESRGWEHYRLARLWLRDEHGLDLAGIDRDEADELGVPYMAHVRSKRGPWGHVVVGQRGAVIHDPSQHEVGYSIDDLMQETVDVLVQPYEPGPDEQVADWRHGEAA